MLLVVNCGSSSVKLGLYQGLDEVAQARVEEVAPGGHPAALAQGVAQMGVDPARLEAAAHRVVHGGARLVETCRITPGVEAEIAACAALAPLHNPANLAGIAAVARLAPDLPQYAAFDTAFHATNPAVATSFALPLAERERGLRRYGFHGLSYAAIVRIVQEKRPAMASGRMLALHLGNGVSLCAIRDGRSVATTMGYSPLDGLTMGTRAGSLDGMAVLDIAARHGIEGAARLLNRESGLLALGAASDMRALHAAGTPEAAFAVDHFCYWAVRHAGSMIAAMGGLDTVVFTGGIGENDPVVRARILSGLEWAGLSWDARANAAGAGTLHLPGSHVAIWTVPAEEERQIALETRALRAREAAP